MKFKTVLWLLMVLCLLSGIVFYVSFDHTPKKASQTLGEKLFDSIPLENVSKITITSSQAVTHLIKENSLWVIENRFNYLADFSLITNLVSRLKQAKISRSFKASEDAVIRLGLTMPNPNSGKNDVEGVGIEIQDVQNKVILHVILGTTREKAIGAGEGNYVMFPKGEMIFLVDQHFDDVGKTSQDWMKENIIDVEKEEIQKISCYDANGNSIYTLRRPEKGQWPVFEGMMPESPLNPSKIDDILTPLSPMSILGVVTDISHNTIPDNSFSEYFEYTFYDGTVFKLVPGKYVHESGNVFYLLKAQRLQGATQKAHQETEPIDALMPNWIYQIPKWKYERFIPRAEMFFEN